ncbi:MAG: PASTA domain-containing protein [Leptospirales bacterium]|nr:PASTA domain-containing protein [Leptospirales bacterium]
MKPMQTNEKPGLQFLIGGARLWVYFSLALALFFAAAVLVFALRGQTPEYNSMPNVTGRYYVDVHDDLTRRLQLRVSITRRQFPDQNSGLILFQSIPAGKRIEHSDKVELVVNQPEPLLTMPDLVRSSLSAARASVERLTSEDRVYSLTVAAVSEIETEEAPAGTVLAQQPPAGQTVSPGERVYLLAAAAPATAPATEESIDQWIGQNVTVLGQLLARRGREYRIVSLDSPPTPELIGQVHAIQQANGILQLAVYYQAPEVRYRNGYELAEFDLEEGECRATLIPEAQEDQPLSVSEPRLLFVSRQHSEDETVRLVFFRTGLSRLEVYCGEDRVHRSRYKPDDLS